MATGGCRISALLAALALAAPPAARLFADEPADSHRTSESRPAADRVDVVGETTISWYLNRGEPPRRTAALIERFREVSTAHLTRAEPPPTELTEPPRRRYGRYGLLVQPVPAELIPTMFFHVEGGMYCSDSTVPSPHGQPTAEGEAN